MAGTLRTDQLEPIPIPEPEPPARRVPPGRWVRENLFSTWYNILLTLVFAPLIGWVIYRVARFVFVTSDWEIVERNLRLFLVFRFPEEQFWRLWVALFVLVATFGIAAGSAAATREAELREGRGRPPGRHVALRRAAPIVLLLVVLLWVARSLTGTLLVAGLAAVAVVARYIGRRVPRRHAKWTTVGAGLGLVVSFAVVIAFGGVGWDGWGGLLLTLWLAVAGIVISFPIGVLLALGRRSSLPGVRLVCVLYIELIRGVPLVALLFMGAFVIGFALPPGFSTPSLPTRALIAIVMFTAAYVAEIVRGGLQSVPKGQYEAAHALGLSTVSMMRLVILPQALRAVIPAIVGQFISLFKDTSLVFIIGLTELLAVAQNVTKQSDFIAQGRIVETLLFASFVYWIVCYSMSRESQRLERRLGVGER